MSSLPVMLERRSAPRYIVEGLEVSIDGIPHKIIDLSLHSVRVTFTSADAPQMFQAQLHRSDFALVFYSVDGTQPRLERPCPGRIIRMDANFVVFRYQMYDSDWLDVISQFDTMRASTPLVDIE